MLMLKEKVHERGQDDSDKTAQTVPPPTHMSIDHGPMTLDPQSRASSPAIRQPAPRAGALRVQGDARVFRAQGIADSAGFFNGGGAREEAAPSADPGHAAASCARRFRGSGRCGYSRVQASVKKRRSIASGAIFLGFGVSSRRRGW